MVNNCFYIYDQIIRAKLFSLLYTRRICFRFAGANPTLRDNGRGLRADQWARFCGRYVCADVIEKHARQRLLERSTSYGNWGGENEMNARIILGKVMPVPSPITPQTSNGKCISTSVGTLSFYKNFCFFRFEIEIAKGISFVFRSRPQ